jgi:hypothetical protein
MPDKARYSLSDVERTLRKHEQRLLAHPNVLYLAIGEKIRLGTGQKRLAIRVCVSQKMKKGYGDAVPKRLRGINPAGTLADFFIPTDVETKPRKLKALGVRGGDSITAATLGSVGLVFNGTNGQSFILTNAHVSPGVDQFAQGQPVSILGGPIIGNTNWATHLASEPGHVHTVDAAVIIPSVQVDPFAIDGYPLAVVEYGSLVEGSNQPLFYLRQNGTRRTFLYPHRVMTPRLVDVEGHEILFVNFFEMTLAEGPPPVRGDSGSVLVSDDGAGLVVHALLFAGDMSTVGVIAIDDVFQALSALADGLR